MIFYINHNYWKLFNSSWWIIFSSNACLLHCFVTDLFDKHQNWFLHFFSFFLSLADLVLYLLKHVSQHFVKLFLGLGILWWQFVELSMHSFVFFQKFLVNYFDSLLTKFSLVLKLFSDFWEVPCERFLNIFNGVCPLLRLSFNEIPKNGTFFIDESTDSCVRGSPLLDVLIDHLQGHFLANLCFLSNRAICLCEVKREFLCDFAKLNQLFATTCFSSQCLSLKETIIDSSCSYSSLTCRSKVSSFRSAYALCPILRLFIFSVSISTRFSVRFFAEWGETYVDKGFTLEIET